MSGKDKAAAGLILLFVGVGLAWWYHTLARPQREQLFARITGSPL